MKCISKIIHGELMKVRISQGLGMNRRELGYETSRVGYDTSMKRPGYEMSVTNYKLVIVVRKNSHRKLKNL